MDSLETKKLALLRIYQILHKYSDCDHPLTQAKIAEYLEEEYGIFIERKAISRNVSLLNEAGIDVDTSRRTGSYLVQRDFEDAELKLLIDGVMCSKHISVGHSAELIEKLCGLSNTYFRSRIKNIHTVGERNKTENQALFLNIEMVDIAIEEGKQLQYDYNKYGVDKKLHKTSRQIVTPYQLILHNQRYYLMAYCEYWGNMVFHRLDHISNIDIYDQPAKPLHEIAGYERGIDYKRFSSEMPYMYADAPERVQFLAAESIIDHVVDWFGKDIKIEKTKKENEVRVSALVSPTAMEYWAMQYLNYVEVLSPAHLRETITGNLQTALKKYTK